MKRHTDVSLRMAENIHTRRTEVTESKIRNWFREIHMYAEEKGIDFLDDPERVFNLDETAFFFCPSLKVLTKRGAKQVKKKKMWEQ